MTEQKIQVGDKVRFTRQHEGVVDAVDGSFHHIPAHGWFNEDSFDYEILSKRTQVGDVAEGRELDALPVGSLAAFDDEHSSPIMRTHDGWVSTTGRQIETCNARLPRVVLYIPSA